MIIHIDRIKQKHVSVEKKNVYSYIFQTKRIFKACLHIGAFDPILYVLLFC